MRASIVVTRPVAQWSACAPRGRRRRRQSGDAPPSSPHRIQPTHHLPPAPTGTPLTSPSVWRGDEPAALAPDSPLSSLPPPWKVLLLSDGSVTRHLQLLTGAPPTVEVLEMSRLAPGASAGLPDGADLLVPPLTQRRVVLKHGGTGEALVYAASWWNEGAAAAALGAAPSAQMWTSLAATRAELYRDIRAVYLGGCPFLEGVLGEEEGSDDASRRLLWGRHYLFWKEGAPLTVVYEVFSPALQAWLGPLE